MKTTYRLYNGFNDYLTQEGQRAGMRADKPYNVYLMIKALEENGTHGNVYRAEADHDPLIELITEEDGIHTSQLLTVKTYLRYETKAIQDLTGLKRSAVNDLLSEAGFTVSGVYLDSPKTIEEAQKVVSIIRTVITTIQATM